MRLYQTHSLTVVAHMINAVVSFWVCEKSDGVRVLFLIVTDSETLNQTIFLVSCFAALL